MDRSIKNTRATYRELTSPLAQIQAARDFLGQMEAVVADTWRERDEPEEQAKTEHESSAEFLDDYECEPGEYDVAVLLALRKTGLRFEIDSEIENGGADGYFRCTCQGSSLDFVLHDSARQFTVAVKEFAPAPWGHDDTLDSLGWENLVLVPDDEGSVAQALRLVGYQGPEAAPIQPSAH